MSDSTRRLIVMTGATRGLGRALVEQFAELGHVVAGCGRSTSAVADLSRQFTAPHDFAAVDAADDDAVKTWAERIVSRLGPPDLLVNNAGLMNNPAPLWQISANELDAILRVNVSGVANVIRHFAPAMVERKTGVIVNLSSGWGRTAAPNVAPYVASKFAVEGLTKSLARELPKGMAAVAFNPGVINTDMLRQAWAKEAAKYPSPEEWAARAAPFLLSLNAQHNGQSLSLPETPK